MYNLSDLHIGNKATHKKRIEQDVQTIADDPNAFWVGGGDYAEFLSPRDRRFDPSAVDSSLSVADLGQLGYALMSRVRDLLKPIAGKCFGLVFGNHEEKYMKQTEQQQLHAWLCTELGVPDLGYSGFFGVTFIRNYRLKRPRLIRGAGKVLREAWQVVFFVSHGSGSANTPTGKLKKLRDALEYFDADVVMIGHLHGKKADKRVTVGVNRAVNDLTDRVQLGVLSGSYLRTYAKDVVTYGEMRMYRPVVFGPSVVKFRPKKHEFVGEV